MILVIIFVAFLAICLIGGIIDALSGIILCVAGIIALLVFWAWHDENKKRIKSIMDEKKVDKEEAKKILKEIKQEEAKQEQIHYEKEQQWRIQQARKEHEIYLKKVETGEIKVPKCPTCQSTKITKISTLKRIASVDMLGVASNNIGKTFKCDNCGYKW